MVDDNTQVEATSSSGEAIIEENSPIETTKKFLEENRKVLEEIRIERRRFEKAVAESLVNGQIPSGQSQKKELTPTEKAKEFFKGSAVEVALEKYG